MFRNFVQGRWYSYRGQSLRFVGYGSELPDHPCFDYYEFVNPQGQSVALTHSDIAGVKSRPFGKPFWKRIFGWIHF